VGTKLKCKIVKVINSGAFLELESGIEGFLHIDDYSWTQKIKNPSSVLNEGQEIDVIVVNINPETRKIKLGVKQLQDDPWKLFQKNNPKGSIVEGTISSKTDFGLFVKVADEIEALIHKNNLLMAEGETQETILDKYKEGEKIKGVIMEINPSRKKLAMSERELKKQEERQEISQYLHDEKMETDSETFTLGDLISNEEEK
jgi:small subunit ribosomal protein S1